MDALSAMLSQKLAEAIQEARKEEGLPELTQESIAENARTEELPRHIATDDNAAQVYLALMVYWKDVLPHDLYRAHVELAFATNLFCMMRQVERLQEEDEKNAHSSDTPDSNASDNTDQHQPDDSVHQGGVPATESGGAGNG